MQQKTTKHNNIPATIKKVGVEWAEKLAYLGAKTFYDAFAADNKPADMELYISSHFTTEKLVAEFNEPGAVFYIAMAGDAVAGYMKTGIKVPPQLVGRKCMELERLYLLESYHGRGIGRQLLEHYITTARQEGYEVAWLGVWEHNPKAIGLYKSMGFTKFGEHTFQLGNDPQTDDMMKLELNANT